MTTSFLVGGLAVLASSFWGSLHCATMCGPVASLMAQRRSSFGYHIGRGLSYILVGAIGGFAGSFFLASDLHNLRVISGIIFAVILILIGTQVFLGKRGVLSPKIKWLHSFYRPQLPGFVLGALSIFLPCGWLYSFILGAAATQSAFHGGILMALFWLGGLPALSSVSLVVNKSIQLAPEKKQRLAGAVLIVAGLYSLGSFYFQHSHHCM
jgi:sulfite exporter TauE/SafE